MQDVLIVSYLVSKEFDLLSRSIFVHSDDCCEDCGGQRHRRRPDSPIVVPDLSCALPLRCPSNELDRGPMTRNAHVRFTPKKRTCAVQLGMSSLGQKRTHAVQKKGHSITSSVRNKSDVGMDIPRA